MTAKGTARSFGLMVAAALLGGVLVGCASTPGTTGSSSTSATSPTVTPLPSPDPSASAAEAAMTAYQGFRAALTKALRTADPSEPALARYAQDRALAQSRASLLEMQQLGIVYRGQPANAPTVASVDLKAPRPTVVIRDCVDNSDWHAVYKSSGKSAAAPGQRSRVPATASVQQYMGRWLVFAVQADRSTTC